MIYRGILHVIYARFLNSGLLEALGTSEGYHEPPLFL